MSASASDQRQLLLVEDNPGDALLIQELLAEPNGHAHRVVHTEDLQGALSQLDTLHVDVILLDLKLPDCVGVECVEAVRATAGDVPIVVVTGIEDDELALSCINAGAQDFLWKADVGSGALRRAIAYALARHRKPMEARGDDGRGVELRRRNDELVTRERQMHALAARLNTVAEQERTRIARQVHDELGQLLTGVKMDLDWIERRLLDVEFDRETVAARLGTTAGLVDTTIAAIQRIAMELRPSALDALGLAAAVRDEARRFETRTGVDTTVDVVETKKLESEVATELFRIVQELLTNVGRHARASSVGIALECHEDEWVLRVEDDGVGIRPEQVTQLSSLGLLGMRERAESLGGTIHYAPAPIRGTRVTVRIPRSGARRRHAERTGRG